jgi:uncharacterized membrane-anchored protein
MNTTLNSRSGDWISKVPEVTVFFWIIKVLGTTVGETAADYLNKSLGLGLHGATLVMGSLFVVALLIQLRAKKYIPWVYWLTVILISIVGTLITDNLSDRLHVPLAVSTIVFSVLLIITFIVWFVNEKTLSIHSIYTLKRELFYWLAILFTFALGTAGGDFMGEALQLGYLTSLSIFAGAILVIGLAFRFRALGSVLSFWLAYILTRPLGASLGDLLTQKVDGTGLGIGSTGGLGFGKGPVNLVFFALIIGLVVFLSLTRVDRPQKVISPESE